MNGRHNVAWRPTGAGSNVWHVVDRVTGRTLVRLDDRARALELARLANAETLPAALAAEARRLAR